MFRLIIPLLLVAAAQAQPVRGLYPWWETPVVRDLNLNEDQNRQIRNVLRENRTQLVDLRAGVEKAEIEVEDLFNDDAVDQKKGMEAIERLVRARGDLTRVVSVMSLKLRAVLTAQQWRELQRRRPMPGPQPGQQPNMRPQPGQGPGRNGPGQPRGPQGGQPGQPGQPGPVPQNELPE